MNAAKYILLLSLTACAHAPQTVSGAAAQPAAQQEEAGAETLPANLPKQALTGELLYEYLVSEIGNQRGYKQLAVEGSGDLARKTRDPRVAKRAAQLAFESGDMDKSISSLRLWQALEPDAPMTSRLLASILLRGGKLEEAQAEFAKVLQSDPAHASDNFLQIAQALAAYPDKAAAFKMMSALAQPYQ
ncbi:MAG: hypothetical protein ABL915_07010, partial [Gallionella sp.]